MIVVDAPEDRLIRIFVGFDPRETVAYHVLARSIQARASAPVAIAPLALSQLKRVLTRERHALQSTDFSFSRFLTPYLSDYAGWSLFMDCDMLMRDDVARLWDLRDERYAVQVVKHDHRPRETTKFLGAAQTAYSKKNWSSVMLFNNARCKSLTPDYVNSASGLQLHQFQWLESDAMIGELPQRWNHLVGYDAPGAEISLAHFTIGGPYFPEYADCPMAEEWRAERDAMLYAGSQR
ncbi:MAG: glycosyltransferase [Betaproteobacteria bacterium]|nr:MAG: glycosyltransferase [Betaproteobacteria bacterium]